MRYEFAFVIVKENGILEHRTKVLFPPTAAKAKNISYYRTEVVWNNVKQV
jgi:hypothetical protein